MPPKELDRSFSTFSEPVLLLLVGNIVWLFASASFVSAVAECLPMSILAALFVG